MTKKFTLYSFSPVAVPGGEITVNAQLKDSDNGTVKDYAITWEIIPANSFVTFKTKGDKTDEQGKVSATLSCASTASVTIKATVTVEKDTYNANMRAGFSDKRLLPLRLPQLRNGMLDEKSLTGSIQAMVLRHTNNPAPGDEYTFYWGTEPLALMDDGENLPWVIDLKKSLNEQDVFADGQYTVYYTVKDIHGNFSYSAPVSVTVSAGMYIKPIFDVPVIVDAEYNVINIDLVTKHKGVDISVSTDQENPISVGDNITLFMKVTDKKGRLLVNTKEVGKESVTAQNITDKSVNIHVNKEFVTDTKNTYDDVRALFWYNVSKDNIQQGTSFTQRVLLDTVVPYMPAPDMY